MMRTISIMRQSAAATATATMTSTSAFGRATLSSAMYRSASTAQSSSASSATRSYSTSFARSSSSSFSPTTSRRPLIISCACLISPSSSSSSSIFGTASSIGIRHQQRRWKSCGIVGLPNVGKSTLFNALTDTQLAEASNYPFCTIEPNIAHVAVPDPLLVQLASIAGTSTIIGQQITFVDIAGIIAGASSGAGLGNKFLANIQQVDVILHVVRCFDDPQIIHVDSRIDPVADMQVIEMELMLADLQTIEKRIENVEKRSKFKDASPGAALIDKPALYAKCRAALNAGVFLRDVDWSSPAEEAEVTLMQLLTSKPMAYVCNVDEQSINAHNKHTTSVFDYVAQWNASPPSTVAASDSSVAFNIRRRNRSVLRVCSQLESEVQAFDTPEARQEFLDMNSLSSGSSLRAVIATSNAMLGNICYYTVGVQEARAWTIDVGTLAPAAAGKIHSDLAKGFVCAEVMKTADYIRNNGEEGVKREGLMKVEGKGYVVQDGDMMNFRVQGQKAR